jgi:prolyl-tRNA editing enzyme YbaK/EbsC (Cys-tRNA(Pro) deacylase)
MLIFFSHYSSQKPLVKEISKYLPKWINIWVDEYELNYGENLPTSLQNAIEDSVDYVIVLLSKEALSSEWVKKEIEWALSYEEQINRTFIVPMLLNVNIDSLKDFGLSSRLAVTINDLSDSGIKTTAEKIVLSLSRLMDKRLQEVKTLNTNNSFHNTINDIVENLKVVPLEFQSEVEDILLKDLNIASQYLQFGEIHIYPSDYYRMLHDKICTVPKGTEVLAISLLRPNIWQNLDDQKEYAKKNYQAILRGVKIKRIFIVQPEDDKDFQSIIDEQKLHNIEVRVNRPRLNSTAHLEDFVIFKEVNRNLVLIGHQDRDNPKGGLLSARVIISPKRAKSYVNDFNKAWSSSDEILETITTFPISSAPGLNMKTYTLKSPVISCEEAAKARGIPLVNELKSIVLETSKGRYVVHLPADGQVDLRRVKNFLDVKEAYILDPELLVTDYDLSPGRICAILEPIWSLPHLVSKRVLTLKEIYTNNKTRIGYFKFSPNILMHAENADLGDFEKT